MKLRKILYASSSLTLLAGTVSIPFALSSCANNVDKTPKIENVEVRCAPINVLYVPEGGDRKKPVYRPLPMSYSVDVYHFNKSEVGYICVDDYVKIMMELKNWFGTMSGLTNYSCKTENGITTITNDFTTATCKIDYKKQTMTFSDYDAFLCYEELSASPLSVGCGGGESYYTNVSSKYICGGAYTIDLSNYNIKAYLYDGYGFVPYDIFRNLINPQPLTYLFYNGVQFYEVWDSNSTHTIDTLYAPIAKEATIKTAEFMEYTYNLLAITLDHRFGLTSRPSRVNPGKTIKYFANGAYEALKPFHDRIVSLEPNVSNNALAEFFAKEADDGGHAGYRGDNLLSTEPFEAGKNIGPEKSNTFATQDAITPKRSSAKFDPESYWVERGGQTKEWVETNEVNNYYEEYEVKNKTTGLNEKVAYLTFDSFNAVTSKQEQAWTEEEFEKNRCLQSTTDKNNYWQNTMRLTMYANKQLQDTSKNIKKLVLDISNNGGGTVYTEHFLASWLCKGVTEKIYNPHTNSYCEYTVRADIDGDGLFNANDYIADDVQVYVITTAKSFSCGNMLPCNLADNRPNTIFIGQPSGGGACFVDGNMHIGLGNVYRSSSNYHMLRNASSYNNYVSVESGCPNDYAIDPMTEPEKLYDRNNINDKIVNGF